jgi:hypothetical protein
MPIVGGPDIHRKQITFDCLGTVTGQVQRGQKLAAAGVSAHLAEPAGTAFARGRKRHAKTDETDWATPPARATKPHPSTKRALADRTDAGKAGTACR